MTGLVYSTNIIKVRNELFVILPQYRGIRYLLFTSMSFIHLSDYISQWALLRNLSLSWQFDVVVYEQFALEWFEVPEWISLHTFQDLDYNYGWSWMLQWVASKYKSILLIIDQTHRSDYTQALQLLEESESLQRLHIICLHSGISWMMSGIGVRNTTAWVTFHTWATVHDPYDVPSFFKNLDKTWVHLHTIHDWDYPNNIFESSPESRVDESLQNMSEFGFAWHDGTVVTSGRVVPQVMWALQLLQDNAKFYDLFVSDAPFTTVTTDLRDSLMKTEKLIVIWDHDKKVLHIFWTTLLYTAGLYETEVVIITPSVEWVTTTQSEYLYEQSGFGKVGLIEKLG